MSYKLTDNSRQAIEQIDSGLEAALEACGQLAESYAKTNMTQRPISRYSWYTRTGRLRNNINHQVFTQEKEVQIGTNVEYAPYVEYGTGPKANGTTASGEKIVGRQDVPWFFKDENGIGHLSYGIQASHFLKKAVADHKEEYKKVVDAYI